MLKFHPLEFLGLYLIIGKFYICDMANDENKTEWRVGNVSLKTDKELEAIAHNLGMNKSAFIRSEMIKIISAQPEHMKKFKFRD